MLPEERLSWARAMRKPLGPEAPRLKRSPGYRLGPKTSTFMRPPSRIRLRYMFRQTREAAKMPPGAPREGNGARPPHTPPPPPEPAQALRASQDPARNRAAAAEDSRRRRHSAGTSFLNAGHLDRSDHVACIASPPEGFWGYSTLSAIIANLAQLSELSAAQKWRPPRDPRRLEVRLGPWPPRGTRRS